MRSLEFFRRLAALASVCEEGSEPRAVDGWAGLRPLRLVREASVEGGAVGSVMRVGSGGGRRECGGSRELGCGGGESGEARRGRELGHVSCLGVGCGLELCGSYPLVAAEQHLVPHKRAHLSPEGRRVCV